MDLQFHLEAFEFMILSDNTKKKKKEQQKQVTEGFLKENECM